MVWVRRVFALIMVAQIMWASFQPSVRYREPVRNVASAHRIMTDVQSAVTHHHQQTIVETVPLSIALLLILLQFVPNFTHKIKSPYYKIKKVILPLEPQPPRFLSAV